MRLINLIVCTIVGNAIVCAQQQNCGVETSQYYQFSKVEVNKRLDNQRTTCFKPEDNDIPGVGFGRKKVDDAEDLQVRNREYVLYLAVHVLGNASGSKLRNALVYKTIIQQVNEHFKKCNLGFVVKYFGHIENSPNVFTEGEEKTEHFFRKYNKPRLINVYYVDTLYNKDGENVAGISAFPEFLNKNIDRIAIAKQYAFSPSVISHELGHYFGLLHTHETIYGKELVNQSNCETTGDKVCDTPADPNLATLSNVKNCEYTGNVIDANGDKYTPDYQNIMSYAPYRCRNNFTQGQCHRLRAYLLNYRGYLKRYARFDELQFEVSFERKNDRPKPLQWDEPNNQKLSDLLQLAKRQNKSKILLLVGHPMINWTRRLKNEITHTPIIANKVKQAYVHGYYEIGNSQRFFQLSKHNYWIKNQVFYKKLSLLMNPTSANIPSLVIIQFDQKSANIFKSAKIISWVIGYRKPAEIKQILRVNHRNTTK